MQLWDQCAHGRPTVAPLVDLAKLDQLRSAQQRTKQCLPGQHAGSGAQRPEPGPRFKRCGAPASATSLAKHMCVDMLHARVDEAKRMQAACRLD